MGLKAHHNYVVLFADGACKVGVTTRPMRRIRELERKHGFRAVQCALLPATDSATAFSLEAHVCRLTAHGAMPHSREWHRPRDGEFDYLKQTSGMFWHQIARAPYEPKVFAL